MKLKYQISLTSTVLLLSTVAFAQSSRPAVIPSILYHRTWKLIKDTYFDQTFGGQDWSRWEHRYDKKLATTDDAYTAIKTMLASLGDENTAFISRNALDEGKQEHLFSIGLEFKESSGKVLITTVAKESPAFFAGIISGDELLEVDGKSLHGQSLDHIIAELKGPMKTKVAIKWRTSKGTRKGSLTRELIPVNEVLTSELLPENIGYIRMNDFILSKAITELQSALKQRANADSLILDFRANQGGLMQNAKTITNMFLKSGVICSTVDADKYSTTQNCTADSAIYFKPMVLLIDGGTVNGAEMVAAALKDNGRAKLIGSNTAGKNRIKAINMLGDGSGVTVTIARWMTPNGIDIFGRGVNPDYVVTLPSKASQGGAWWKVADRLNSKTLNGDLQLAKACAVLRSSR